MTEKYRVHEIVRFSYSDIGEYIDENHTDKPLRNDEICQLLNELHNENKQLQRRCGSMQEEIECLSEENEQLKSESNMLKITIGRNEAYIKKLTEISEWHC